MQLLSSKGSAIASSLGTPHMQTNGATTENITRERSSPRRDFCWTCHL